MSYKLSQSELNELLHSLPTGSRLEGAPPLGSRHQYTYDFRAPSKLTKDQMVILDQVHSNMAAGWTSYLSAMLRIMVEVRELPMKQYPFSTVLEMFDNPTLIAVVDMPPLSSPCLIELDPNVLFPLMERLMGGDLGDEQPVRDLSDLELAVINRIVQGMLPHVASAWRLLVPVEPRLRQLVTNPYLLQAIAPSEMVSSVIMHLRLGEHLGNIRIAVQLNPLQPYLKQAGQVRFMTGSGSKKNQGQKVTNKNLNNVRVPVAVELGSARVTVAELGNIGPGDVLVLQRRVGEDIDVYVADQLRFRAQPGRSGDNVAIKITEVVEPRQRPANLAARAETTAGALAAGDAVPEELVGGQRSAS